MATTNLVCRALLTRSTVDDSKVFGELIEGQPRAVYADRIYDSLRNKAFLAGRGSANGIMKKGGNHITVTAADRARNRRKNRRRRNIERIFGHWKRCQGYRIVRYLGLVKNQLGESSPSKAASPTTCGGWPPWPQPKDLPDCRAQSANRLALCAKRPPADPNSTGRSPKKRRYPIARKISLLLQRSPSGLAHFISPTQGVALGCCLTPPRWGFRTAARSCYSFSGKMF